MHEPIVCKRKTYYLLEILIWKNRIQVIGHSIFSNPEALVVNVNTKKWRPWGQGAAILTELGMAFRTKKSIKNRTQQVIMTNDTSKER